MKIFIETADPGEAHELLDTGLVDGIVAVAAGGPAPRRIAEICALVPGPVLVAIGPGDFEAMLAEAGHLMKIDDAVAIAVPPTPEGLKVCAVLSRRGAMVVVAPCVSPAQALLAAKARAMFVSAPAGSADVGARDGRCLIDDIRVIFARHPMLGTRVLGAPVREPDDAVEAARAGAYAASMPPAVFCRLFDFPEAASVTAGPFAVRGEPILPGGETAGRRKRRASVL